MTVGVQHLKSFNYLPDECQQVQEICDCIWKLRENKNLEAIAEAVLKGLGEMRRPYLTQLEEDLLSFLETKS